MSPAAAFDIRPLRADDRADWGALWRGYLDFYETEVSDEVYEATWARLLSGKDGEYAGLIAREREREREGAALGLAHYLFHRHCWRIEDVCYLQDLFVAPGARRGGVGEALIKAVYERADATGAGDVYWTTQHFNASARSLYDRVGRLTPFIKYSRR